MVFVQVLGLASLKSMFFFSKSNTLFVKDITTYLKLWKKKTYKNLKNLFQLFKLKSSLF